MLSIDKFGKFRKCWINKALNMDWYYSKAKFNDSLRIYASQEQFRDGINIIPKGNCSTDNAVDRLSYGDIYDSHALTFYLYNLSALRVIEKHVFSETSSRFCSMLELGCNNGFVSRFFQRNGFKLKEYWGMDFDFPFIVDGLENFEKEDSAYHSNFFVGDFNKPLPIQSNYFDLVYMQEAFDHCKDKGFYAHQCLDEIRRVLKPGGYLYITLVFEHDERDLYHWDHNYIWSKFEFENVVQDYYDIANFTPLLTFGSVVEKCYSEIRNNWPLKFSKMLMAQDAYKNCPNDIAVGSYLLRNK